MIKSIFLTIVAVIVLDLLLRVPFVQHLLMVPLAFIGAFIGTKIQEAIAPDYIVAGGLVDILKQKVIVALGPSFVGGLIGGGLALYITGYLASI